MPSYDYGCTCGEKLEVFHSMSESPRLWCPSCNSPMTRLISATTIITKTGPGKKVPIRTSGDPVVDNVDKDLARRLRRELR